MMKNDVARIVSNSINAHAKGDTISKPELESILTDVLTQFGESKFLSKHVSENISREEKLRRNIQGLR